MKIALMTLVMMFGFLTAKATTDEMVQEKDATFVKYENKVATYQVPLCPIDAPIEVRMEVTPSVNGSEFLVEPHFFVPNFQCYANTHRLVEINIYDELQKIAKEKGIHPSRLVWMALNSTHFYILNGQAPCY